MLMAKNLDQVMQIVIDYRNAQGWESNDQPNNLAKSIFIESTELLRNFEHNRREHSLENIKEEVADILMYVLALTHDLGFSAEEIVLERINSLIENKL
ncbi:MAG: hypothetical protein EA374_01620 [Acholeplasmatales bacterium]|nr:MAG: hypothetical protein EA374_01620 [Acholeplasmatales bacterium]